jgi:hypothetical protein
VLVDVGVVAFSKKKDIGVVAQLVVQSKCSSVRKLQGKEKGERQQIGKDCLQPETGHEKIEIFWEKEEDQKTNPIRFISGNDSI